MLSFHQRYCEICETETEHSHEIIRNANIPPDEETCTSEEMTFYLNGDSVYRTTCIECGYS